MSTIEVLITARQIAEQAGIEWKDLEGTPLQQVAQIRSRVAQKTLALREELMGLTRKSQQREAGHRIAA